MSSKSTVRGHGSTHWLRGKARSCGKPLGRGHQSSLKRPRFDAACQRRLKLTPFLRASSSSRGQESAAATLLLAESGSTPRSGPPGTRHRWHPVVDRVSWGCPRHTVRWPVRLSQPPHSKNQRCLRNLAHGRTVGEWGPATAYLPPTTIAATLRRIQKGELILPTIQREYVLEAEPGGRSLRLGHTGIPIKGYRDATNVGLAEAKAAVEAV